MQNKFKKIGIIGAMNIEIDGLCRFVENQKRTTVSGIEFTEGTLYGKDVVLAVCGIGKTFAAICAQTMIIKFGVDALINTGVAGTLTDKLSIGNIAVSENVVQHDMDTSALGDPVGLISGINQIYLPASEELCDMLCKSIDKCNIKYVKGTIASGDKFVADSSVKERIVGLFDAVACEMEGASIGLVCYINRIPFAVLRAISDGGNESSHMDYPEFAKMAAQNSIKVLKDMFENL
ncbi:MAG: 5'-methylthioadenosine/adenosylhomocysteine nucleosidase [Ruminococcaceae bacterium]|nr:5'-methylthioadenosine/adenosylhomocysteine nucleosidase [Oscillospiraceae bacterium]